VGLGFSLQRLILFKAANYEPKKTVETFVKDLFLTETLPGNSVY
jgi:hypothetical protein